MAQGGFDMAARAALADAGDFPGEVILAGFETLPWACRVARPGAVAEVLGTKDTVDAAVAVFPGTSENLDVYAKPVLQTLQIAVGPVPEVRLGPPHDLAQLAGSPAAVRAFLATTAAVGTALVQGAWRALGCLDAPLRARHAPPAGASAYA